MSSYRHKKLIERIAKINNCPFNPQEFLEWIKARAHLDLLMENANSDEIIISANAEYSFIYAALISNADLSLLDKSDLLEWDGDPYYSEASYVYGGGREDVWIESGGELRLQNTSIRMTPLVYKRIFEGEKSDDQEYFEINQEYAQVTGIHWRSEHDAFVKYDENGDIWPVVSATHDTNRNVALVTFTRGPLEEYLAATDSSLIRRFDFTLLRNDLFSVWSDTPEIFIEESEDFYYRQKIDETASYTNGQQIIPLSQSKEDIFNKIKGNFSDQTMQRYADFIINDRRNGLIAKVSTNPNNTTNYFEAKNNSLPYELSPAFFRPDVLAKYKNDPDKYTLTEYDISCRAAWHLKAYDINDAGQVHAYICDLRNLPYSEQLYWASFNEEPKTNMSERAITQDFHGEFSHITSPLNEILQLLRDWDEKKVSWWNLKEAELLNQIYTPTTDNKDEWAEAFMRLSKLIIEGFNTKNIRSKLGEKGVTYDQEKSIALLEKLFMKDNNDIQLKGLRTTQLIRTKVKGHSNGSDAKQLEKKAREQHKNFKSHFEYICGLLFTELSLIENSFSQ